MSSRIWQSASIAVVCAAAVVMASACGSSGGASSADARVKATHGASKADHHEDADTVCRVVTAADASKLFGAAAMQSDSSLAETRGSCIWNATKGHVRYTLIGNIYDAPSAIDVAAKAAGAAAVPGIGDRAYVSSVGSSAYEVWLQKGGRVAHLEFLLAPADRGANLPSAATYRAAVLQLARALAARM
jgi:hypothetical protein